jgi:RNA polymerase sigma-70 factor (ECF subfamily)
MVYNLALRYVQSEQEAEEITQDVFLKLHQSMDSFREEAALSTFIYRIAVNRSLDQLRARKRRQRFSFFFRTEDQAATVADNEGNHHGIQLEQKEELKRLYDLISTLPENQATALILHKIEKLSQAETAEVMKISAKAVESLVQRAKTNLAKKISDSEG